MLKVLLCDDEPFILQGLKVLIDWEAEGYTIAGTVANGREAIDFLRKQEVNLIISDIKMPVMDGLELLKTIRTEKISDAYVVMLTGYKDFEYVHTALKFECMDYVLKPVEKPELIGILRKIAQLCEDIQNKEESQKKMEDAYLARNVISLLYGKFDAQNVSYVENHIKFSKIINYVDIELTVSGGVEEHEEGVMRELHRDLYRSCVDYLKDDSSHCIFDVSREENSYDVGLIYCDYMGGKAECDMNTYLQRLKNHLNSELNGREIRMFVGKAVSSISDIAKSYTAACVLKSVEAFRGKKDIYYYENEVQVSNSGVVLCKEKLDELINAIETNDPGRISKSIDALYEQMQNTGLSAETMDLNINYLLFQLVHLATQMDDEVNQEEILRFIGEHSFEEGIHRGSRRHLSKFACEYGDYLEQIRKNASRGVLLDVEKEIRAKYAENITLRDLGKKFYINSSYLGQLFQKKYGQSFKDYLTAFRINEAEKMLLSTDKKVAQIAEEVGYKDSDYFIRKFIALKGCTPSRYRKMH